MASNLPPMPPDPPIPPDVDPAFTPPPPPVPPPYDMPPSTPEALPPLPWEQPGYPFLEGLYETAKLFFTDPTMAFSRMQLGGELGRPLIYAIIFGWLGTIAGQVYNLAMGTAWQRLIPQLAQGSDLASSSMVNVAIMVGAPLLILLGIFVGGAIYHLFLMLYGGANSGFGATVRVLCYASTVQVLQVLPLCGGMVAMVWGLVIQIIGLAIAHRTTRSKAAMAVLTPALLCCICVGIGLAVAFFGFAAMLGKMR